MKGNSQLRLLVREERPKYCKDDFVDEFLNQIKFEPRRSNK